jgi:hypothetical protein
MEDCGLAGAHAGGSARTCRTNQADQHGGREHNRRDNHPYQQRPPAASKARAQAGSHWTVWAPMLCLRRHGWAPRLRRRWDACRSGRGAAPIHKRQDGIGNSPADGLSQPPGAHPPGLGSAQDFGETAVRPGTASGGQYSQKGTGEADDIPADLLPVVRSGWMKPGAPEAAQHGPPHPVHEEVVSREGAMRPSDAVKVADHGDGGLAQAGYLLGRQSQAS